MRVQPPSLKRAPSLAASMPAFSPRSPLPHYWRPPRFSPPRPPKRVPPRKPKQT